ncbi:MAG: hypothetical protein RIS35_87 [Pseudomonadota bacterium]
MSRTPRGPAPEANPRSRAVRARGSARQRGSTLAGFLGGLVTGLAIAVVVALVVTQGSAPFVNRAGRAPERALAPKSPADAPDPNAPLQSKNRPAPKAASPEDTTPPSDEDRSGLLERLFGRRAQEADSGRGPEPVTPKPKAAPEARPGAESRSDARPDKPAETPSSYLLQAGAFRSADEADAMRARLALVGLEARVVAGEVNGQPIHRVRVGPFGSLEDMNRSRARLAENGIEASVVRQK